MNQPSNGLSQGGGGDPARLASFFTSRWRRPAEERREADLLRRLTRLAFTQVGHSRRIAAAPAPVGQSLVFSYVCETGFEHRRQSHRWLVAARDLDHGCTRATITAQEWLIAAAWSPASREILLADFLSSAGTDRLFKTEPNSVKPAFPPRFSLIVVDDEAWRRLLRGGLGDWLASQPADRSWEIAPGLLVACEAARSSPAAARDLAESIDRLSRLLTSA